MSVGDNIGGKYKVPWSKELGHRSVEREVVSFCGFNTLRELLDSCHHYVKPNDVVPVQLLILSLFKTGGRINEVLTLRREQCEEIGEYEFRIHVMPVLKKRSRKVMDVYRDVPIRMTEELTSDFINLLPTQGRFFWFKYNKAYNMIRDLQRPQDEPHGPWFPHRFRAERARQLVRDYGFDALLLKQFFNMGRIDTPLFYANPDFAAVRDKMLGSVVRNEKIN